MSVYLRAKFQDFNIILLKSPPGLGYIKDLVFCYVLFIPSVNTYDITITNAFQKILNESNPKPNKIWVDKGSKFDNRSMLQVMVTR